MKCSLIKINLMRKITTLALMIFTTLTYSYAQLIPNGGMENWIPLATYDSLEHWSSTNLFFAPSISVVKTTDAHSGTYAARMNGTTYLGFIPVPGGIGTNAKVDILAQTISGGYPFTLRPNAFTGWYKYTPQNNDSCIFLALLTKTTGSNKDTIGTAVFIGHTQANYTNFYTQFFYFSPDDPDTAFVIALTSANFLGAQTGSVLFADDLDFTLNTGVPSVEDFDEIVKAYPNPAKDEFNIELKHSHTGDYLKVFNVLGNNIVTIPVKSSTIKINTAGLSNGLYFYRLENEKQQPIVSGKFSVKH